MSDPAAELAFQNEIIAHLTAHGWLLGNPADYDRERALYPEDVIGYVKDTQPEAWEKFTKLHPQATEDALLALVASLLEKADPNASSKDMRKYGTLGVLRHPIKDRGVTLRMCQFKPDHDLNPATLAAYGANRLRVVAELKYSPHAKYAAKGEAQAGGKDWRIDLVLFVNGIPVATLELKSEFKQSAGRAVHQYRSDRLPKDPATGKPEPLLTFKRGALVHFAVSQFEVAMCTRLAGMDSVFLPFNKGTKDGGAGNDVPEDGSHPTSYLWREVFARDTWLNILGRFVHLQIEEKEDWQGKKYKAESLIFPRYHQWDVVSLLVTTAADEGPGECYLVQHSAGSGKSNSIAWAAHQLSSLHTPAGEKQFHSVIVITDRTVLDDQLQDTIYQFEHREGVVGRINREEGEGTKSQKLAEALLKGQPIIIVTIQTFPFVLEEIQKNATLKTRNFAIIADEAHSSQTGSTARKLREVLMAEQRDEDEEEISAEDMLDLALEARRGSKNLSYFAFTATPKPRTLELFGRLPDPTRAPAKDNLPEAFHVYSMRQAIEEKFILDVLRNYTTYGKYLSRLNRTYPGKAETGTFVLDFVNDPQEVLDSFLKYHKTATLSDVSDPNQVHTLFDKLGAEGIYQWSEVEQFATLFFNKKKGDMALSSICKPAWDRWRGRYQQAMKDLKQATDLLKRAKKTKDAVLIANAESEQRDAKGRKDTLDLFKKDLGTFTRFYEFMSQIVDYDDKNLEKLNLYARHLAPLLREENPDDDTPDLTSVQLTHYRLQKQREQDLMLNDAKEDATLTPGAEFGSGRARDKKLEALSQIIARMNDLFAAEDLSDADKVSYAETILAKIRENSGVMTQVRNNTPEQAMLGDFPKAVEEAVLASGDAHHELMAQFLANKSVQVGFARMLLDMLSKTA